MQRRTNIQGSSSIILLSILTILVQFIAYYFFDLYLIIWGVSCLISMVCCHILLEQTTTYEACFLYSLLALFVSLVIIVITYWGNTQSFMPYTGAMSGIAIINWLIPFLYCFFRNMFDYSTKIENFNYFYLNISIIFCLFYSAVILYGAFISDSFLWAYPVATDSYNFIPFGVISTVIEDYLYNSIPLSKIIIYLVSRIVIFLPYGFYIALLFRKQTRFPKFLALFLFPFLIEVLQFIFVPSHCDIDDLIYALIGGILGSLSFHLTSLVFHALSGKTFLSGDNEYRFHNSSLHF